MMMAHDSTPNRPGLSAASRTALRTALERYLEQPASSVELQESLRAVAAEAREKRIHAEQLLVIIKDIWYGLPQIAGATVSDEKNRLMQRVVSLCIREYYATPDGG
jgi:hypothetical protein